MLCRWTWGSMLAVVLLAASSWTCEARPLRISDVLQSTEGAAEAVFLPGDRRALLAELAPYDQAGEYSVDEEFGQLGKERSRLQALDLPSASLHPLNQAGLRPGTWMGPLSPDGTRVVVNWLDGIHVRTRVTDLASGTDTALEIRPDALLGERSPVWTSNESLVYAELPEGRATVAVASHRYSAEYLPELWHRAWEGKVATTSELVSGHVRSDEPPVVGRLVEVNLRTKATRVLGPGNFDTLMPAPRGGLIAALAWQNRPARAAGVPVDYFSGADRLQLQLFRSGVAGPVWALDPDYDVAPYSVQWSADGSALLFAARRSANLWRREARLYRLTLKTQRLEPVSPDDLRVGYDMDPIREPLQAVWVGRDIVVSARRADDSSVADGDGGKALYVWRGGTLRPLPLPPGSMPFAIVATSTHAVFILRANSLWKIPVSGAAPTDLTTDIPGGVRPAWDVSAGYRVKQWTYVPPSRYVALETLHDPQPKLIVVDVVSGKRQVMRRPSARAKLIALSHTGNSALMTDAAPFDTLYLASADGSLRSLRSYNPHLAQVDPSVVRKIAFNGRHGEKLHAWLVLPPDYRPGRKYPVIVEVYGDSMRGESATLGVDVQDRTFNPHVFAAFGYACLLPSMPLEPMGRASDPAIGISHDALAALDAAVADGAIDASRPALYGHSYGMFTGLGVLMETERFRVAGLISGFSDLASEFGSLMPSSTVFAPENLQRAFMEQGWAEGGQGRMGVPPWEDPARYVRNSGYFNAQRIRTPLFLAHGDLDEITMTHSEKMFSALLRLGRDAKFVRYWGEGHNFSSPANIRDLWQQLLAWYDDWLDLARDDQGRLIFEGDVAKSRGTSAALTPADFTSFDSRK